MMLYKVTEKIQNVLTFNVGITSKHPTYIVLCDTLAQFSYHMDLNKLTIFLDFTFFKLSFAWLCKKQNM